MVAMPDHPSPPRPVITRKDVARLAGVSTAVVSYVVNGGPKNVAPATQAKVRQAIAALGYRPNVAARALKKGSSRLLGMVVPKIGNPFFASLAEEVEQAAEERGFAMLLADSRDSLSVEQSHLRNFVDRQVDGVFLCSVLSNPDVGELEQRGIRTVLLNFSEDARAIDAIGPEFTRSSRQAVEHLGSHGHTEIALIVGIPTGNTLDRREIGWRQALQAMGQLDGRVYRCSFDRQGGYEAGQQLLASSPRPGAVFISSDQQAIGFLRAIHEAGLRIPEDVAVMSFDGSEEAEYCWPPLSTVRQPVREMAEAGVKAIIGPGRNTPPQSLVFDCELVLRRSCGCTAAHDAGQGVK
ncbi:LacI family DNA-binding transcriptional regulator [Arthrobacter sp. SDTb3-6]|uniref:LacI family DNA-binding transcriptional regulator n=1 Tax=Arthrobacter sp. SDTb3-6 TaxID=2713571 RepID=UPI00159E1B67|nr:LacI family DNA-binding transcriptional regulator [Arthrobacter sp. SDTb3-6]NVN00551.1 LacI family transcriptional regulator [Arthrobacter sp. SDTb3-6]